jgi:predicted metal-dependent hydrolase
MLENSNQPVVEIIYKDKKHSSGRICEGKIILYISSRLKPHKQQDHIDILTLRLLEQYRKAQALRSNYHLENGAKQGTNQGEIQVNNQTRGNTKDEWEPVTENIQLEALVHQLNKRYFNFEVNKIAFHMQRSIWGSCSIREKNIYISHRLKGAPRELLEYVIIHELAHLKVPNHGKKFWELVEKACPDYLEIRKRLQLFGAL